MTQVKTWLAIADGEHARFVAHDAGCFHTVQMLTPPVAGQRTSSLMGGRLGRSFESANVARHAVEARSDPQAREKHRLAAQVAARLNEAAAQHLFVRLVLVTPPRTLPAIEEALDPDVRRRIAGRLQRA